MTEKDGFSGEIAALASKLVLQMDFMLMKHLPLGGKIFPESILQDVSLNGDECEDCRGVALYFTLCSEYIRRPPDALERLMVTLQSHQNLWDITGNYAHFILREKPAERVHTTRMTGRLGILAPDDDHDARERASEAARKLLHSHPPPDAKEIKCGTPVATKHACTFRSN